MAQVALYAFAFVVVGILDLLWVVYTQAVMRGSKGSAAGTAAILYAASGVVTLAYVADPGVLVAGTLGAFAGTYVAVKREKGSNGSAAEVNVPTRTWTVVGTGEAAAFVDGSAGSRHGDGGL